MPDANLTKKLYCDALLSLCESRKLSDVTVTALVAQAGTARQTFYNHFNDVNDLIGYLTTNILETYVRPAYFRGRPFSRHICLLSSTRASSPAALSRGSE